MNKLHNTIPEAPESNAGDDFHVLWTIRKSFGLLNFDKGGLKAITIEGIEPKTKLKIDPYGNKLLGVDIAEYYGGTDFNSATKVVVSQLKYSTRRINDNWTFSGLYKGKRSSSKDGSVFHRMGSIYKAFLDEYGREDVINKLTFKLVSNRALSLRQKQLLDEIQSYLLKKSTQANFGTILKKFPGNEAALTNIQESSKLKSKEFTDFLCLLDFEECGEDSSYGQELKILEAFRNIGTQDINQYHSLFHMVWRKMLPDAIAKGSNIITDLDLLYCLNMSMDRLYPVDNRFESIKGFVQRNQIPEIISQIIGNQSGYPICIHGCAGIGKSTISQQIKSNFPKDSEVILFDCYGEGTYLNPSDSRHLHKESLLQISNDIAKKLGSPFLANSKGDTYLFIRELKIRIESAIRILEKRKSNSLLVLIIDAADNSIIAAESKQTKSFIHDLVIEQFPDNFRLIVTSRSHRIPSLNLPENSINIEIKPFDYDETKSYLTSVYADSTHKEILDFHDLTNGIPRVQTYALKLRSEGIDQVINYLKPNGKKVEDIIQERIVESATRMGNEGQDILNRFFTTLISLPRPVPISYVGMLSEIDEELLHDILIDIWHGLVLDEDQISFRDEDFEEFIRRKYSPNDDLYRRIADQFIANANSDEYASLNLGIALLNAGYDEKLKEIVLEEQYINLPVDPIRKKSIYVERAKLAMQVSKINEDNLTLFKLLFISAEVARTEDALNDLVLTNAELVASYGKDEALQRLNKLEGISLNGAYHFQLAATYSRHPETVVLAKRHLDAAEKWVDWWLRQNSNDRAQKISPQNIAYGAEAYLRIDNPQVAWKWLNRWSPKSALLVPIKLWIGNLLKYSDENQVIKWLKPLRLSIYAKFVFLNTVGINRSPLFDLEKFKRIVIKVLAREVNLDNHLRQGIITFCEQYLKSDSPDKSFILDILNKVEIELPEHLPSFMENSFRDEDDRSTAVDIFLRKQTIIASLTESTITTTDIYPEKFRKNDDKEDYKTKQYRDEERRKFDKFYKHAIAIYQFRSDILIANDIGGLKPRLKSICKSVKEDWDFRYYDRPWVQYKLNFLALILIDVIPSFDQTDKLVETIVESFENQNENRITLRIAIAEKISKTKGLVKSVYYLLNDVDTLIQDSFLPASDRVNFYIQAAKISRGIDKEVSIIFFDKAIEAVSEIDIEAQEQIKCISNLSKAGISNENARLAFEFSRFIEFSKSRLDGYDHFPLSEGLEGIAYLDCATAYAVLCRWNHRNIIDIPGHILNILHVSLTKGFIGPTIGSSFLPGNNAFWESYVSYIHKLIQAYNEVNQGEGKNYFVRNTLRDIQIYCPSETVTTTFNSIYEKLNDGRFIDKEITVELNTYHQFINNLFQNCEAQSPKVVIAENGDEEFERAYDSTDILSSSSLNEALKRILEDSDSYSGTIKFLRVVKEVCEPKNYVSHLEALVDVSPSIISFNALKIALQERLLEWDSHPLVKKWKQANFGKVVRIWFSYFSWNDTYRSNYIREFADYFSIQENDLLSTTLEIMLENIGKISATTIYELISFLKGRLDTSKNEVLIEWILRRWNTDIKSEFADGLWDEKFNPGGDPDKVVAQALRFILGHPDKRLRWRAVHALRRIVNSGNTNVLKELIENQNLATCHPFQDFSFTYFWISAKLYLWVSIARLAKENPKEISKFKDEIIRELSYNELPHALIYYFIKLTCQNLMEYDDSIFSTNEKILIDNLLVSQHPKIVEDRYSRKQRKYASADQSLRFNFDAMDTLPYWYSHLGDCFNLSEYDVADIADRYISEIWGYSGDHYKDDHVTVPEREYGLTSNRQGSLPTVENLRTYYEYHAMYCAASDLLEKEPLVDYSSFRTWDSWLESEALSWKDYWLSDLRDPIPLEEGFWKSEYPKMDASWQDNIPDESYDKVLGLGVKPEIKSVNLYGHYTKYIEYNYESISIKSAIVSPESSDSLLRALQTAESNHDFWIPLENDHLHIDIEGFKLFGWLRLIESENEGLDTKDPFSNDLSKCYMQFGNEASKVFDIGYSLDNKIAYHKEKVIGTFRNWSNVGNRESYNRFESGGYFFNVDIGFVLKLLKRIKMDLIIECTISRNIKDQKYDYENNKKQNNSKLYLIKSDGKIRTLRGRDYKIR